jgi:hypothetical protein
VIGNDFKWRQKKSLPRKRFSPFPRQALLDT